METQTKVYFKEPTDFKLLLEKELESRIKQNPSYSLRAFAQSLKVSHAALSQIINAKRPLTKKMVLRLGHKLELSPESMGSYLKRYEMTQNSLSSSIEFEQRDQDQFDYISNWYHYAILELIYLKDFNPAPRWIAKRLKISINEVNIAVKRLISA